MSFKGHKFDFELKETNKAFAKFLLSSKNCLLSIEKEIGENIDSTNINEILDNYNFRFISGHYDEQGYGEAEIKISIEDSILFLRMNLKYDLTEEYRKKEKIILEKLNKGEIDPAYTENADLDSFLSEDKSYYINPNAHLVIKQEDISDCPAEEFKTHNTSSLLFPIILKNISGSYS